MKPPEELVPGLAWSGNTTLLAAREKQGKSTYVAFCAAVLSRGKGQIVLWVSLEESEGHIGRRFKMFGASPDQVFVAGNIENRDVGLRDLISECQASLVVIDSLTAWATHKIEDMNSSGKVTPIMLRLASIARETNVAMVVIHHATKSGGKYRDSTAIGACVDMIIEMAKNRTDNHVRSFRPLGRWSVEPYRMRFTGTGFEPCELHPDLFAQVLEFIERNPGCSKRGILEGVTGGNPQKTEVIGRLLEEGKIIDHRDGNRCKFEVTAQAVEGLVENVTRHVSDTP
jgi:hypothetical protein